MKISKIRRPSRSDREREREHREADVLRQRRGALVIALVLVLPLVVPLLLLLDGCKPAADSAKTPVDFSTRFTLKLGGKTIRAQVAATDSETSAGLMWRTSLAADEGMLFVFPASQQRSFWMRNVPINLALAYIDEAGRIDEIKAMVARDPELILSRSERIRYVLEMPEGWFAANGIATGAQLDTASVRAALQARGFRPERYVP